jgi:hypothetical protein
VVRERERQRETERDRETGKEGERESTSPKSSHCIVCLPSKSVPAAELATLIKGSNRLL